MPGPKPSKRVKRQRPIKLAVRQHDRRKAKALAKIETRGGARVGAGRKPGTKTYIKRLAAMRDITEDIMRQGKLPLRTMIKYMSHFDEEVDKLDQPLADAIAENADGFTPEQLIKVMEIYAKIGDLRMKAGHFAQMAAPYLHARLSHQSIDVNHSTDPRKLPKDASAEERRERFRRMRSMPYDASRVTASDEHGEPVEAELLEPEEQEDA